MRHISLVIPYYDNPGMLAIHYRYWAMLPEDVKNNLDVVIVDDGSPNSPAVDVPRPEGLPELTIYRVLVDKPWHQHAARNIGAHEAKGPWLMLTDMDHLVPEVTWRALFERSNRGKVYFFKRVDAPDLKPKLHPVTGLPHQHPNSFSLSKENYWKVGGYDEDYCGMYGTDGLFRTRLFSRVDRVDLEYPLIRYGREFQADAATQTLPRKEGRDPDAKDKIKAMKMEQNRPDEIVTLSMPYEKVFP
jgi:hypothetical protein